MTVTMLNGATVESKIGIWPHGKAALRAAILQYAILPPSEKLLLLVIVEHYNVKKCVAWPGIERIAWQCGLHSPETKHRHIRRLMASLESKGIIIRIPRRRRNGSQQSNGIGFDRHFLIGLAVDMEEAG